MSEEGGAVKWTTAITFAISAPILGIAGLTIEGLIESGTNIFDTDNALGKFLVGFILMEVIGLSIVVVAVGILPLLFLERLRSVALKAFIAALGWAPACVMFAFFWMGSAEAWERSALVCGLAAVGSFLITAGAGWIAMTVRRKAARHCL